MARSPHNGRDEGRIADEAAQWVLRRDRGLSPSEQDELSEWLASDPRHGPAMARHRQYWNRLDVLADWRPEHSARPNPDLLSPPLRRRLLRFAPVAVALAAAAVIALMWVGGHAPVAPDAGPTTVAQAAPKARMKPIVPAQGERKLADGSIVELNQDAAITVRYTGTERRVVLERGEAHFAVMKDPARPFIVQAAGVDVCAVGTAFSVRVEPAAVEVLVTHGRVQLESAPGAAPQPHELAAVESRRAVVPLDARQRAIVPVAPEQPPQIATLTSGEIARVLAWQHRLLDFTAVPLRDVIDEFNRRNVVQIIPDPELAAVRVSAAIRSDNVEGLVRLVAAGFGARVERRGDTEIFLYHAQ